MVVFVFYMEFGGFSCLNVGVLIRWASMCCKCDVLGLPFGMLGVGSSV